MNHELFAFTTPSTPRRQSPLPYPSNFISLCVCVCILIHWDHVTLSKYSWMHGPSLEQCLITRNNNLRENALSQSLTIANNFTVRDGISSLTSTSMLRFGVSWTFPGLTCDVSITVGSYVQLTFGIQNALSPCSYLRLLVLTRCLPFLPQWFQGLGRKGAVYLFHLAPGIVKSLFLSALQSVVGHCVNWHILQIELY